MLIYNGHRIQHNLLFVHLMVKDLHINVPFLMFFSQILVLNLINLHQLYSQLFIRNENEYIKNKSGITLFLSIQP